MRPVPLLVAIEPPAAQPGQTVRVTLDGQYLEGTSGLLASHEGIVGRPVEPQKPPAGDEDDSPGSDGEKKEDETKDGEDESEPRYLSWDISVAADVPAGLYEIRACNEHGISAPRAFHVAPSAVRAESDPRRSEPVAIGLDERAWGRTERGEVEVFELAASRSTRVVIECFGERLDSTIDPTLEVFDDTGRSIAASMDRLGSDPLAAFSVEEGKTYRIELWDLTYGEDQPYLLSVTTTPRALFVSPPAVASQAQDGERAVFGWSLPGGEPVDGAGDGLERAVVSLADWTRLDEAVVASFQPSDSLLRGRFHVRPDWPGAAPLPLLRVDVPVTDEIEGNDRPAQAQKVSFPAVVWGRFDSARDRDWYAVELAKGQEIEIVAHSARLGFPCDPVLVLARLEPSSGQGGEDEATAPPRVRDIETLIERKTTITREGSVRQRFVVGERDPVQHWKVSDDGTYVVGVRNRNGRAGIDACYLLQVREAAPDFELFAISSDLQVGGATLLQRGGGSTYDVLLERHGGFEGAVEVRAEDLPRGVHATPVVIGPDETFVPVVLTAAPDAPVANAAIRLVGRALNGAPDVEREAAHAVTVYGLRMTRHPLQYTLSRFSAQLPLAVRDRGAPFSLALHCEGSLTVPPGAKLDLEVELERQDGFEEPVRISLQGFNEKGYPNNNGERPAKKNLSGEKRSEKIPVSISNRTDFGDYTLVAYGSVALPYREELGNGRSRRNKYWHSWAAEPLRVRVRPPVSVTLADGLAEKGADATIELARGEELKIPLKLNWLDGVRDAVEIRLEYSGNKRGLSSSPLKLEAGEERGELVLKCAADSPLEEIRDLELFTRSRHAGRTHDERQNLPFRVLRVDAPGEDPAADSADVAANGTSN